MATEPQAIQPPVSSLCTTGLDPYLITGLLLQELREHFLHGVRIEHSRLQGLRWVPSVADPNTSDVERTTILLEPVYTWDPRHTQARPAVLVRRDAVKLENNRWMGNNMAQPQFGAGDGSETHIMPITGGHTLLCIATAAGIVETLAMEVARLFYRSGLVFTRKFPFNSFMVTQVSEVQRIEESDEHFAVAVQLQYAYTDQWTIVQQNPLMKGVNLNG